MSAQLSDYAGTN